MSASDTGSMSDKQGIAVNSAARPCIYCGSAGDPIVLAELQCGCVAHSTCAEKHLPDEGDLCFRCGGDRKHLYLRLPRRWLAHFLWQAAEFGLAKVTPGSCSPGVGRLYQAALLVGLTLFAYVLGMLGGVVMAALLLFMGGGCSARFGGDLSDTTQVLGRFIASGELTLLA